MKACKRYKLIIILLAAIILISLNCNNENSSENIDENNNRVIPKNMISIKIFELSPFQENTYVVYDQTKECVIIDAGCYDDSERSTLKNFIDTNGLKPVKLLNTHGHLDHVFGAAYIKKTYNLSFEAHKEDTIIMNNAKSYASVYGLDMDSPPLPDTYLKEGDRVDFGDSQLSVIHAPGHSPGSICFYNENQKFVIVGDVLFSGSIGRTDLPGGNYETLISNIKNKLLTLNDSVVVYCGHGPSTTIGREKATNPFLR